MFLRRPVHIDFHEKCGELSAERYRFIRYVGDPWIGVLGGPNRMLEHFYDAPGRESLSYYYSLLTREDESLIVFCNRFRELVAFAEVTGDPADDLPENRFCDREDLAPYFEPDFRVLRTEELLLPANADVPESASLLSGLHAEEFATLSYRQPDTIAQVVFNDWQGR